MGTEMKAAGRDRPESWYGEVEGPDIIKLPFDLVSMMASVPEIVAAYGGRVYGQHSWSRPSVEGISDAYVRLIREEWPKLAADPDDVRIIMGFDS